MNAIPQSRQAILTALYRDTALYGDTALLGEPYRILLNRERACPTLASVFQPAVEFIAST